MGEIQVLPTSYSGIEFRSRLEARWAVFFDACGVKWEYEPEGFKMKDGTMYLPDFKLHNVVIETSDNNDRFDFEKRRWEYHIDVCDLWVEVKGKMSDTDANKIRKFAGSFKEHGNDGKNAFQGYNVTRLRERPIAVVGNIPKGDNWWEMMCDYNNNVNLYKFGLLTTVTEWEIQKVFCIDSDGKLRLTHGGALMEDGVNEEQTLLAYRLAYNAKFDHGRTPRSIDVVDTMKKAELKEWLE